LKFCSCFFFFQRQDTDERLRRLQSDKDALILQVQVLNEQVTAANHKIDDMDRTMTEKNQLITNAEDLLQRVSQFALHVGIQIDKQKVPRLFSFFFF
jgi:chromosome segregation ATPase